MEVQIEITQIHHQQEIKNNYEEIQYLLWL